MNLNHKTNVSECLPSVDWQILVDCFYANAPQARKILIEHGKAVESLAQNINTIKNLGLDPAQIHYAAMLHDIGIIKTDAPGIGCFGDLPYITHGIEGAKMLRTAAAPEYAARVAERHTGSGISPEDIISNDLPLSPTVTMVPETLLEKLICYADKFFSKRPDRLSSIKTIEQVRAEMSRHGQSALRRFEELHTIFAL